LGVLWDEAQSKSGTGSAAAVPIPIQPAGSQVVVQELPKPSSIAASPDWYLLIHLAQII
jgi:hypothetical protein